MVIPYGNQWIEDEDIEAVVSVLKNGFLTQGPQVEAFEKEIAEYVNAKYCVVFCNATAALQSAVKSLDIGSNLEGITSTNTFVASSNCLAYNNIKPVFADIDPVSYNITENFIKEKITDKTRVLIPVHFAGQPCNMEEISKLAKEHNLYIIEDAAHAIGSCYTNGNRVGNNEYADMTVFSFHPVKTMTTGEGGAVTTNSPLLFEKLKLIRGHGITKDPNMLSSDPGSWYYEQQTLGYNFRITDLQCALGRVQLSKLERYRDGRRKIIEKYNKAFRDLKYLSTPLEVEGKDNCLHLYTVQIDFESLGLSRKELMDKLREKGVGTQVLYIPVHTQPWYQQKYSYSWGDYPNAEFYYERALSLPLFPKMSNEDIENVIEGVQDLCL